MSVIDKAKAFGRYLAPELVSSLGEYWRSPFERECAVKRIQAAYRTRKESRQRRDIVHVDQPLLMVTQIQRSGGNLFRNLLDGHPSLYVYPFEVKVGKPKWHWPEIDLSATSAQLYRQFRDRSVDWAIMDSLESQKNQTHGYKFEFNKRYHKELFRYLLEQYPPRTQRDVFDKYFTAFFNAWLDYEFMPPQRDYVVGFTPRINMHTESVQRFFSVYPQGRMLSVLRDPVGWFASAVRHSKQYQSPEESIAFWKKSALASIRLCSRSPQKVKLVLFSDLIEETEQTMRGVASWLGIPFDKALTMPTFNSIPKKANTSFKTDTVGVIKDPTRRQSAVDKDIRESIDKEVGHIYEQAKAFSVMA